MVKAIRICEGVASQNPRNSHKGPEYSPQRALRQHERLEVWKHATQSADLDPVRDRVSIQVQFANAFMGDGCLAITIAAR